MTKRPSVPNVDHLRRRAHESRGDRYHSDREGNCEECWLEPGVSPLEDILTSVGLRDYARERAQRTGVRWRKEFGAHLCYGCNRWRKQEARASGLLGPIIRNSEVISRQIKALKVELEAARLQESISGLERKIRHERHSRSPLGN